MTAPLSCENRGERRASHEPGVPWPERYPTGMREAPPWQDVLEFWFGDCVAEPRLIDARIRLWFRSDAGIDAEIARRFGERVDAALADGLGAWAEEPHGRLALVLLLDQFTRNVFRGSARAFAGDERALALAREGIARGHDQALAPIERAFLGLPLEHAEDVAVQALSVERARLVLECLPRGPLRHHLGEFLKAAEEHAETVRRFGRYPHRNRVLGRASTPEEIAWLDENGRRWGQ